MTPEQQAAHTPFTALLSCRAIGKIPYIRAAQFDLSDPRYVAIGVLMRNALASWKASTPSFKADWKAAADALPKKMNAFAWYAVNYVNNEGPPGGPPDP